MNEYEKMSKDELLTRCMFLEEVLKERDEQIEKMKCCGNCEKQLNNVVCVRCKNNSEWELAR